jgi:hypothetical protein
METLKTGVLAYFDSFAGLVPVKVLSVTASKEKPLFNLGIGSARISTQVSARVTADLGVYRKGEVINSNSVHIVPRGAVLLTAFSSRIAPYNVEADQSAEVACC